MIKNNGDKSFIKETVLSYKPDFNLEILETGVDKFQITECKSGDFILKTGEICKRIFMAESSVTRCYFTNKNGEEKTIWLEPKKTVITDYESFSTQNASNCDICCYEDSLIYSIDRENLMALYAQYHDWAIYGLLVMEEHYVNLLKIKNLLTFNSAAENYDFLESYFKYYLDVVPLKHLASWLNISAVHLSRIRKERIKLKGN
ncbi:Crp/Fnr family transcriptional regulator [Halpernia frigidisoli]|uniref:cAMP-binding domain of CRP or a regulatory subunit of cAMP-dependent protein kinases n=1 Tax=Halpernia frigidisoli TaxID=1125876 RepID=A0A1I3DP83_9FLAO|nr:cyclic nucleotide-binding domain-containing protein [Halpernia frigidisoli]SFH88527.1 cAMP-binding domain of CRP or a regulatory subunit of cAMP-dependent protein kinases [Halpernia frigidisoli]